MIVVILEPFSLPKSDFLYCIHTKKCFIMSTIMARTHHEILLLMRSGNSKSWRRGNLVAYDPRRHQGMTLRRQRSRHPRASSPLDRRRRRMPSFTTPSEDLISPRHISQGSRARGVIFPVVSFIMYLFSPHVFKRAFASLLPSLLGR